MNVPIIKGQLLYFGTIIRKKGILELAGIFNQIITKYPKASLLLIGTVANDFAENTSTLKLFYNLLSTKAKEKVKYLDAVSYDEIKLYISKANVVVLPSFAEAFPMTWLETLALKKPLVSSNIGWAQELMINNVTGYTISPKNHVDYANKILELLNNDDLCLSFGKSGREHVEKYFSAKAIIPENVEFYKQLIQS